MPYIESEQKAAIDEGIIAALGAINDPGQLNYAISTLVWLYINSRDKINYAALNEVMGVMECAKNELYRRVVSPYEDKKIVENGDVFVS